MKYIRKFETHNDYQSWKRVINAPGIEGHVTPNACWCVEENEGHTERYVTNDVLAFYDLTNKSTGDVKIVGWDTRSSKPAIVSVKQGNNIYDYIKVDGEYIRIYNQLNQYSQQDCYTNMVGQKKHVVRYRTYTVFDLMTQELERNEVQTGAFMGCTDMTEVIFPETATLLNGNVLSGCTGLESITFLGKTPPRIANSTVFYNTVCPIYVPDNSVKAYILAWESTVTDIESRIRPLSYNA